jgi:transposase
MRKIREILRLRFESGLSHERIATSIGCGKTAVGDCLARHKVGGLGWPLAEHLDDAGLELSLYPPAVPGTSEKPLPVWSEIHTELRKKSVTMQLLWCEYKANHPAGYQYTQFCHHYSQWKKTIDLVFRNEHIAGEKAFVDYAGQTMAIHDPRNGQLQHAQIFIGVLGASNFTFAEATWSQTIPDWIESHNRMYAYFGGVPEMTVPDNLRSGVTRACRYDPLINPTYYAMARHYKTAIIPARKRKPRDKAKAEQGVLLVERWILAALRNRQFFSLDELNRAILELLERLNTKEFQKLKGTRRSTFEELDRPALKALPTHPFEICEFKIAKVNINYHIEVARHFYSVPSEHVRKEVEARYTARTVEILLNGQRIASHKRSFKLGGYTTLAEHMPRSHQEHVKWTPNRMTNWVGRAGPSTAKLANHILKSREHPQQAFSVILGMIRLGEKYGNDRLDRACFRALRLDEPNYRSLKSILTSGLDGLPVQEPQENETPIEHQNIRGPEYYS